jgi:threonine dehydrogenase-like Zn-dependent dehydrogenase
MGLPASDQNLRAVIADVAVVGYGPVGMVVAALL